MPAWIKTAFFLVALIPACINTASAGTRVWLLYGAGGQSTSTGIDEIAARARRIPGVTAVTVREHYQHREVEDEILAAPSSDRIVVGGYSCGLNGATAIARDLWQVRHIDTVVGIQASKWCGGDDLESNVRYGQSTYGGCIMTLWLGCKQLAPAPSFTGNIRNIKRPDLHSAADNDPDAQRDVLEAITVTALYGHRPPPPAGRPGLECRWIWTSHAGWYVICYRPPEGRNIELIRRRGESAY
jgi:hypothetical protein